MSLKKQRPGPTRDALAFLNLAFGDYVSSRVLLLQGLLPQGAGMAATAVEKYLKAILAVQGQVVRGHLTQRLLRTIENHQPKLHADLNIDFINYLARAYTLRYFDNLHPGFNIVVSQFRTLAALDVMVAVIDHGFDVQRDGTALDTAYRAAVKSGNAELRQDNIVLSELSLADLASKENRVYELRVTDLGGSIAVEYVVAGVRLDGGYLDREACVVGSDPRELLLSRG